jgi:hypothetical protein
LAQEWINSEKRIHELSLAFDGFDLISPVIFLDDCGRQILIVLLNVVKVDFECEAIGVGKFHCSLEVL